MLVHAFDSTEHLLELALDRRVVRTHVAPLPGVVFKVEQHGFRGRSVIDQLPALGLHGPVIGVAALILAVVVFVFASGARRIYSGLLFAVLGTYQLFVAFRGDGT